jgi:hypothetical protein
MHFLYSFLIIDLLAKYPIMILLYSVVGSTSSGSAFVIGLNLGAKTILSWSHFEDDSSPYISWSSSSMRIIHTFVLFKHVILIWINYLETWLRSDNTSCYYINCNKLAYFEDVFGMFFFCLTPICQKASLCKSRQQDIKQFYWNGATKSISLWNFSMFLQKITCVIKNIDSLADK